ncbi:hypothetical protein Plhal304r1_c045g0125631 [Plasmopara halstedii]
MNFGLAFELAVDRRIFFLALLARTFDLHHGYIHFKSKFLRPRVS